MVTAMGTAVMGQLTSTECCCQKVVPGWVLKNGQEVGKLRVKDNVYEEGSKTEGQKQKSSKDVFRK